MTPAFRTDLSRTLRLALPLIGGQVASLGMNILDTVMSGRVGPVALGAIAVGSSLFGAIMLFMMGVLLAVPPVVSQLDGANEHKKIAGVFRQSLWVALGLAVFALGCLSLAPWILAWMEVTEELVPTVLGYLKALAWGVPSLSGYLALRFLCEGMGKTRPTLYFGLLGLACNFVGNYLLMYGHLGFPELGAIGCGYSTAIVWTAQLAAILVYVRRNFPQLDLFERFERPQRERLGELVRLGLPIGVTIFMETSLFAAVALLIGSLGTVEVASHQVAMNFAALTFMIPLGLSMAITVRVGNALGREDPQGTVRAVASGFTLAAFSQLLSVSVMILFPHWITSLYTQDQQVASYAAKLLFFAAVFQVSDGIQVCSAGALRGLKDTQMPMIITSISYWGIGLPVGAYLCFQKGYGAPGLWIGLIAGLTAAAVLLGARLSRLVKRLLAGAVA